MNCEEANDLVLRKVLVVVNVKDEYTTVTRCCGDWPRPRSNSFTNVCVRERNYTCQG